MLRKTFLILISLSMLVTSVACGKNTEKISEDTAPVTDITSENAEKTEDEAESVKENAGAEVAQDTPDEGESIGIDFLREMEGYWIRPEGYTHLESDMNVPDVFVIDSKTGKWRPYSDRKLGDELSCIADIMGLVLSFADGSKANFVYDGIGLLNSDGSVAFIRTDDLPQ